jgi:peptidoglycan/LPS O-acetylase OafA/YrhL
VKRTTARSLGILAACLCGGALLARGIHLLAGTPSFPLYVMTHTRIDALAAGALIALAVRRRPRPSLPQRGILCAAAGFATLALLVASHVSPAGRVVHDLFGYTTAALCGAMFIWIAVEEPQGKLAALGRNRVLVFFGKYSYGLYLLHRPTQMIVWFVFDKLAKRLGGEGNVLFLLIRMSVATAAAVVVALISWNLLEKHFLELKRYFHTPRKSIPPGPAPGGPPAEAAAVG